MPANRNQRGRTGRILDHVARDGELSVEDACRLLDVSTATVRRDFCRLAEQGQVERTWGGVRAPGGEPPHREAMPSFSLRGGTREILRGMIARGMGLR